MNARSRLQLNGWLATIQAKFTQHVLTAILDPFTIRYGSWGMVFQAKSPELRAVDRLVVRYGIPAVLFPVTALGWWWSFRMAADMRADGMSGMAMSTESAMSVAGFRNPRVLCLAFAPSTDGRWC